MKKIFITTGLIISSVLGSNAQINSTLVSTGNISVKISERLSPAGIRITCASIVDEQLTEDLELQENQKSVVKKILETYITARLASPKNATLRSFVNKFKSDMLGHLTPVQQLRFSKFFLQKDHMLFLITR